MQTAPTTTGKISGPSGPGAGGQSSIMLRATDAQAQKIALVYATARQASNAYWTLMLRPGLKSADSPNSVETAFTLLSDGISSATLRAALGVAVTAAAAGGH